MRALLVVGAMCAVASACPAYAELSTPALRNGYDYAVRCFAAAPFAKERGLPSDNGDKAFSAAYTFATKLGQAPGDIGREVKARTKIELQKMQNDPAYLSQALSDCKRLGLL